MSVWSDLQKKNENKKRCSLALFLGPCMVIKGIILLILYD